MSFLRNPGWVGSLNRAAVGGGITPPPLTSLRGWWKADSLSLMSGEAVTSWPDSSGNGLDMTGAGPSITTGAPRSDFTGFVGYRFVPAITFDVNELGRWVVSGNSRTHTLKLANATTGIDLPGGSVVLDTSGKPAGAISYAALASPVALTGGQAYFLGSAETSGLDQFVDNSTYSTPNAEVMEITSAAYNDGTWHTIGSPNSGYAGVDLKYGSGNISPIIGSGGVYTAAQLNGYPALRFNIGRQMSAPAGVLSGLTEGELFVVQKIDNQPGINDGSTGWGQWPFSSDYETYVWTDGSIYSGIMSTARKSGVSPGVTLTNFHVYNIISTASEWTMLLNGTQKFTTATNTFKNSGSVILGYSGNTFYMKGYIAEVIFYASKLSTADRSAVKAYITAKYGITLA